MRRVPSESKSENIGRKSRQARKKVKELHNGG
jgi:hypothetical protein